MNVCCVVLTFYPHFLHFLHFRFKLRRWRPTNLLKMTSFTDTLQELCLDFKQVCIPFWNYQSTYFPDSLSILGYDSIASYLILICMHLETAKLLGELTHPMHFLNDIPPKRIDAKRNKVDWFLSHSNFVLAKFEVLRVCVVCGSTWCLP